MTQRCRLCRADALAELVDFGRQPICNRFLAYPSEEEDLFPLVLSQCGGCGLVQLSQAPPAGELTPRHPWIAYREPESHLDSLAETIAGLPGVDGDSLIWGISPKDDTLLNRLTRIGLHNTYRLALAHDLDIHLPHAGVETIQDRLTPEWAADLTAGRPRPQVVVARHILEHAHDLQRALEGLTALLAPAGYLVLESPDCRPGFASCDCTTVWEEHVAYFTPATFPLIFARVGLALVCWQSVPGGVENVLTGIGQAAPGTPNVGTYPDPSDDRAAIRAFCEGLTPQRERMAAMLADRRRRGEATTILGAGHRACALVNFLQLRDLVSWVADDDPHKQGLFMPGSHLPIRGSESLQNENVGLCLLTVSPEVETRVVDRHRAVLDRGGRFVSIFAAGGRGQMSG